MTAQTAEYGMDYLNHAQPKDVLRWIKNNSDSSELVFYHIICLINSQTTLTIPCHQFAASVVGRLLDSHYFDEDVILEKIIYVDALQSYVEFFYSHKREAKYKPSSDVSICPINPFTGMLNPNGTQRTSATREEIEQWRKEG